MSVKSKNINHRTQNAKSKFQQRYNNVLNWEALIDVSKIMVKRKKKLRGEIFPLWSKGDKDLCVYMYKI